MTHFKRFLISLFVLCSFFSFVLPSYAAQSIVQDYGNALILAITGGDSPWAKNSGCTDQPSRQGYITGDCESAGPGALSMLNRATVAMYTPPVSSQEYIADLMQNSAFGNKNQAYAQGVGIGFASLSPVLGIWKVFRNVSYFFFVIAFMVVGFAIMLRAKINAQTVVNIQLALPQLVITLVLISFSYAIAGLLVDVMFLTTQFITSIAAQSVFSGDTNISSLQETAYQNSIITNTVGFVTGQVGEFKSLGVIAGESLGEIVFDMLGGGQGNILTDVLGGAAAFTAGTVFALILLGVMMWNAFKILFSLLSSYVMIILLVITAPLRLLLNVYPGSNAFTSWLKELAGHLAVFPVVVGMVFLMYALMGINTASNIGYDGEGVGFSPPQLGFSAAGAVQGLIGIGILLAIPQVIDQVKEFFGVKGGGAGGGAFGGALLGGGLGTALNPLGKMAMGPGGAALGLASAGAGLYKGAVMGNIAEGFATGGWAGAARGARTVLNPGMLYSQQVKTTRERYALQKAELEYYTSRTEQKNKNTGGIPTSEDGNSKDSKSPSGTPPATR